MPNNILIFPLGGTAGPPGAATPKAATFVVSPVPGVGDFTTIEAAVAAAPVAGADIYLREGTYAPVGTIVLPLDRPIRIRGAGAVGIAKITMPTGVPLFSLAAGATEEYSFSGFKATGDLSAGQALFSIDSAVDFYGNDLEVVSCQSIVVTTTTPTVAFTECTFDMLGFDWSFWRGVAGGTLVWNYVTATHPLGFSVSAIVGGPEWNIVNSYIGGAGFGTYALGRVLWNGLKIDFADITINGANSKINECDFQNSGITVTNVAPTQSFILSDSLFFGGGSGGFQLILEKAQNSITGCLFNGGSSIGIDLLVGATETAISGCRFFTYVFRTLRTASTGLVAEGNTGLQVEEVGAADNNRYSDIIDGSTIIGPTSIVNDWSTRAVAVSTLLDETHRTVLVDASGGARTITLPPAAAARYRVYTIKKQDASGNVVTIDADAGELIDGSLTVAIGTQYGTLTIQSDGTGWALIVSDASAGADIFAASRIVSLVPGEGTDLTIAAAIAALPAAGGDIYVKAGTYPIAVALDFAAKVIRLRGASTSVDFTTGPTTLVPAAGISLFKNGAKGSSVEDITAVGDNATSQVFYEGTGEIRFSRINTHDIGGIIKGVAEITFHDSYIEIPSGPGIPLADRYVWKGAAAGGTLIFDNVELFVTGGGATLMSGVSGAQNGPTFKVVNSYVGGGGGGGSTNFWFAEQVEWAQFEIDNAQFEVSNAFSTIVNCGFLDFSIKFLGIWNFISNSKFSQGGTDAPLFDAQVTFVQGFAGIPQQNTVVGCLFYGNGVSVKGISFTGAGAFQATQLAISGCIFQNHTSRSISLVRVDEASISGCVLEGVATGIFVSLGTGSSSRISIVGNTFKAGFTLALSLSAFDCTISGNANLTPTSDTGNSNAYSNNTNFVPVFGAGSTQSRVDDKNIKNVIASGAVDAKHRTVTVDATLGAVVLTLPTALLSKWMQYTFKKTDASVNTVTVDAAGAETIDGALTVVMTLQWERITIQSDGTAWFRID
jgi:hypothetical protein